MFTVMFTVCSLYVHYMFSSVSVGALRTYTRKNDSAARNKNGGTSSKSLPPGASHGSLPREAPAGGSRGRLPGRLAGCPREAIAIMNAIVTIIIRSIIINVTFIIIIVILTIIIIIVIIITLVATRQHTLHGLHPTNPVQN